MTYVLHYAPDNASLIVRMVLEELGLPYEAQLVDRRAQDQYGQAFRAVNPAGLIPALETPQGPMFETAAILLWLADTHGAMAPAPGAPDRGLFLSTLFFTSNTLHAQMRMLFYPWKYVGDEADAQAALRRTLLSLDHTRMSIPGGLSLLNTALLRHGVDGPTILDCYIAAILRWCGIYPNDWTGWLDLADYPALHHMAGALEQRPSARAVADAEGLGPLPFTQPQPPNPPEGSAL